MKLFCCASKNEDSIWRGVKANKWAVATFSDSAMRGRITKAKHYFVPGVCGLLYCNPTHFFTAPFTATSEADPTRVVTDIWPEARVLPFSMRPLGDPRRQVHKDRATARWSILIERMRYYESVSAALNITGTTVFVPTDIPEEAWQMILDDLAIKHEYELPSRP